MQTIILEANAIVNEGISADWVLTGVATILAVVLFFLLRTMHAEIKANNVMLNLHQSRLDVHEERLDTHDKDIEKNIHKDNEALAAAIVAKIRMLKAL